MFRASPFNISRAGKALALALITAFAAPSGAETSLTVSTLWNDVREEKYETYGYLSSEVVSSLNSIGSGLARWGHNRLDLDSRSPLQRAAYLLTAVQVAVRFQWANSIYFGHEFAHFATADQLGYADHHFEDPATQHDIGFGEAYLRTFANFEIGGPAVSVLQSDHYTGDDLADKRILSTAAGVNWQMKYSENWVRSALTYGNKDVFDAPEFLLNRMYLATYAVGDLYRARDRRVLGDIRRWARHIEARQRGRDVLRDAAVWGLAANLLSPSFWEAAGSIGSYTSKGNDTLSPYSYQTSLGSLTWDIPQYLNADSMTLAPMAYLTSNPDLGAILNADSITFGLGLEIPVIGDDPVEYRVTATGTWKDFDLDLGISGSGSGLFAEAVVSYKLTDKVAFVSGAAVARGDTLRAKRNFPFGSTSLWAGLNVTF